MREKNKIKSGATRDGRCGNLPDESDLTVSRNTRAVAQLAGKYVARRNTFFMGQEGVFFYI